MTRKNKQQMSIFISVLGAAMFIAPAALRGQDSLAQGRVTIRGFNFRIEPAEQTVPVNSPTIVNTILLSSPNAQNQMLQNVVAKAELRGPSISGSLTLSTLPNHPFSIPPLTLRGTYTLEDIRLERDGRILMKAVPDKAVLKVMDIVVSEVKVRPLTLQEIREKGIVITDSNFQIYNFTVAFTLESEVVEIDFPVIFANNGEMQFVEYSARSLAPPALVKFDRDSFGACQIEIGDIPGIPPAGGGSDAKILNGVLVFSNQIAFLHQFFSVLLIVKNNAEPDSGLFLKNMQADIVYPEGLREAETNPPHIPGTLIPVRCPGPDGKLGTADDSDLILAAFSGKAEFLAEGLKEGAHTVEINFSGTLGGLAAGDAPVTGKAKGTVLVRNPEFSVTMTFPSVVRAGEEFDAYYTVTNISKTPANLFSLTMPAARAIGARLLSPERVEFEILAPGQSETAKFHLLSLQTGKVTGNYFQSSGGVKGNFILTLGVGEKGIPLSPDTLSLPSHVNSLPPDLVDAAMLVLGEAYSIATAPGAVLPAGLPYVTKNTVTNRAIELAEAGQRILYQDTLENSLEILALDWLGNRQPDLPFDQLRRLTTKGARFAMELAKVFDQALQNSTLADFQKEFAENASYLKPFFSAGLASSSVEPSAHLRITDYYQNRLDGGDPGARAIPYGERYNLKESGVNPAELALIGSLDPKGYTVEVVGTETGAGNLSLIVPDEAGNLRQVVFRSLETRPGSISSLAVKYEDASFSMNVDLDGDGTPESQVLGEVSAVDKPPLRLISATQDVVADPLLGHAVALFFNRSLDRTSVSNLSNYFMEAKTPTSIYLQPSLRVAIIGFNNPISPFFENKIQVSGVKDESGGGMSPETVEIPVRTTIQTPGGIVSGRILTADGRPVPGTAMHLVEIENGENTLPHVTASCFSDAGGEFIFEYVRILNAPFSIEVKDPDTGKVEQVRSRLSVHGQRFNIDIVLRGRGSVRGKVYLEDGRTPAADASVAIQVDTSGDKEGFRSRTNSLGEFFISQVPVGNVSITAVKGNLFGYAVTAIPQQNVEAQAEVLLFPALHTSRISGRVLRNDGVTPVPNAYVQYEKTLGSFWETVLTDSQGNFVFDMVPVGNFTLTALNPLDRRAAGKISGTAIEGQTFECAVILRGVGRVSGIVMSSDGLPLAGILVYAENTASSMNTDQNGEFTLLDIPVGEVHIVAFDKVSYKKATAITNILAEGEEARVTLVIPVAGAPGGISGRVFLSNGNPFPKATVNIFDRNYRQCPHAVADESGAFSLSNVKPGEYILIVQRGNDGGVAYPRVLFPGHFVIQDVRLIGTGGITVNVYAADGKTGVKSNVALTHRVVKLGGGIQGEKTIVSTDNNGRLVFPEVLIGDFTIEATNPFSPHLIQKRGNIPSPGDVINVDLVLKPAGKLTGKVFGPDGITPVANAKVTLYTKAVAPMTLFTDAAGVYFFDILPDLSFEVVAVDEINGYQGQVRGSLATEGQTLTIDIRLKGLGRVIGTVKKLSGEIVPNALVQLKSIGFPFDIRNAVTDAEGKFRFDGISENDLALSARDPISLLGGRAKGTLTGNGAETEINIVLQESGIIEGTILDPDRQNPVAGSQAVLFRGLTSLGFAFTGADGKYKFEQVPLGNYKVEVFHPATSRKGLANGEIRYEGQVLQLDIALEGRGSVEGYFYDTTRANTVPGATVEIKSFGLAPFTLTTNTDENGRFYFPEIPQAKFQIKAREPLTRLAGEESSAITFDGQNVFLNIYAQASGTVKGTVFKSDAATLVPFAAVELKYNNFTIKTANADANGAFQFQFIPLGSYTLEARDQASRDIGKSSAALSINQEEISVPVLLRGLGTVAGRVLDAGGNPLPNINVRLNSQNEFGSETFNSSSGGDGAFNFPLIRLGSYSLEAKDPVTKLGGSAEGALTADGQAAAHDIKLEPAGAIRGRVLCADGATPAEKAVIQLAGTNTLYAAADNNGYFEFRSVRLGAFKLKVTGYAGAGLARVWGELAAHGEELNFDPLILDNVKPFVTSVSPIDGSRDVLFNTPVVLTFSEEMDPLSAATSNITLSGGSGNIAGALTLSIDGRTATFVPSAPLPSFALLTILARQRIEDKAGNTMEKDFSSSFLTVDNVPPRVASISPFNNQIQVALNSAVTATFSEPIKPESLAAGNFQVLKGGTPVAGEVSLADNNSKAVFTAAALEANSQYSVAIANVRDISGNIQAAPFTSSFKTLDTIAPTIAAVPPAGGTRVKEKARVELKADIGSQTDISKVYFYISGALKYTDSSSPYSYTFTVPYIEEAGSDTLIVEIMAVDYAGNQSARAGLTLTILPDVPPQLTLTGPASADILPRQQVTCHLTAADDLGLTKVGFYAQGGTLDYRNVRNLGSPLNFASDYAFTIPAATPAGTTFIVYADAVDTKGSPARTANLTLQVPADTAPPQVKLTSPAAGASFIFGSAINLAADAADDIGVLNVKFYMQGELIATDDTPPFSFQHPVPAYTEDTQVTLRAEAVDASGKMASDEVQVLVKKLIDEQAPKVKITCPSDGSRVPPGYSMRITAQATDDKAVAKVEFYVNDALFATDDAAPYEAIYPVPADSADGTTISIKAKAYDYDDKTDTDKATITVVTRWAILPSGTVIEGNNTTYDGQSIIIQSGTVTINGSHTFQDILVLNGGILTHAGASTTETKRMDLNILGSMVVTCGGKIDVTGKGYLGAYRGGNNSTYGRTLGNTITGGSKTFCGGSYGGRGGVFNPSITDYDFSNQIYGSLYDPNDPGSGGGGSTSNKGGNGGGVVRIKADTVILDGEVLANGDIDATNGSGGSGGSIRIDVNTLRGGGWIAANGSAASYASGGGGRIAVYYQDMEKFASASITSFGGQNTSNDRAASPGTVYFKKTSGEEELVIWNNGTALGNLSRNIYPQVGPAKITALYANVLEDATAAFMPKSLIGMELIPNVADKEKTFTIIDNDRTTITTDAADGDMRSAASMNDTYAAKFVLAGRLTIKGTTMAYMYGEAELGGLLIYDRSILSHDMATTTKTAGMSVKTGQLEIDSTSRIDVSGRGYLGARRGGNNSNYGRTLGNTVAGGSETFCGGSYGGRGGVFNPLSVDYDFSNQIYGSLYDPNEPGSGGGGSTSNKGGNGGGVVRIEADTVILDGEILANGDIDATNGSGGSGGSIRLDVNTLRGGGRISANGSAASYASGGGGRIAVYFDNMSGFSKSNVTAFGGMFGSTVNRNGSAGTIFFKSSAQSQGEIVIDNNNTISTGDTRFYTPGPGKITSISPQKMEDSNASFIPGSLIGVKLVPNKNRSEAFNIIANTKTEIMTDPADGDMTLAAAPGDEYAFNYPGSVTVNNAQSGEIFYADAVFSGDVVINNSKVSADRGFKAKNLKLVNGSVLKHVESSTTATSSLSIHVETLEIASGSKIDVTGMGYLGAYRGGNNSNYGRTLGNTVTGGSETFCGGSYGGWGGVFNPSSVDYDFSNQIYGSLYDPNDPGSGGGGSTSNKGGNGGGVVRIEADTVILDGEILANGDVDATNGSSGSGGSIRLDVKTLRGSGRIAANGSAASYSSGGGGRIAVYYNDISYFNKSNITSYGGKATYDPRSGASGSVYLKKTSEEGELIFLSNTSAQIQIDPQIGPSQSTALSANSLQDTTASFMPKSLVGLKLIPNINNPSRTFTITDNDRTTIFTDPADGSLLEVAAVNDSYLGKFVFPGHVRIKGNSLAYFCNDADLGNLTVSENSILSQKETSAIQESRLTLSARNVEVDASSRIDVSGRGYLGGHRGGNNSNYGRTLGNTVTGGSETFCGGSYGGRGGVFNPSSTDYDFSNQIYGSLYDPNDLGSGGGGSTSNRGGSGGGVVRIKADTISLAGAILANGDTDETDGRDGSGGSGGSIRLDVGVLSGGGRIAANGASDMYSSGGGGRIAIYYNDISGFTLAKITAFGGSGGGTTAYRHGGAGTVFLKSSAQPQGDLIIDNNNTTTEGYSTTLSPIGSGFSTSLEDYKLINTGASFIRNALVGMKLNPKPDQDKVFTILANAATSLSTDPNDGPMTLLASPGYAYIGEHHVFNLTVKGLARVFTLDRIKVFGTLSVAPGATLKAENLER